MPLSTGWGTTTGDLGPSSEPADVIISDVKMPDMDGIQMLREVRETLPDIGVVLMTAFASVETAREAFKLGADDFITKPFDVEELKLIVKKIIERQALIDENRAFKRAQRDRGSIKNIVGSSPKMNAIFQMIETVAQVQSTVLVTGESGTGKELVARALHDHSTRADKPFVPVNCGALPENILESERIPATFWRYGEIDNFVHRRIVFSGKPRALIVF